MRKMTGGLARKWTMLLAQMERDASVRGISLLELAEMSGLEKRTCYKWWRYNQKPRQLNWTKVQATLNSLPVKQAALPLAMDTATLNLAEDVKMNTMLRTDGIHIPSFDDETPVQHATPAAQSVAIPQHFIDKAHDEVSTAKGALIKLINSKLPSYTIMELAILLSKMEDSNG